jgi:predicted GNAT family acetyltransferase
MREIITEPTLSYSKAFIFVMEHFVKMLKAGHSELSICINNSMTVTYALEDGEVIGACVYELDQGKRQAWIYSAAVDENHRGQGVYTDIYKEVERVSKSAGMVVINSNVHIDNAAMVKSADKNGREMLWYRTRKYL